MEPVTMALMAASVASSIGGGLMSKSAATKAARRQSRLTFAQRQEEIRRERYQYRFRRGQARATVAAGNLQVGMGSSQRYINEMDAEFLRQEAFAKSAARRERRAIRAGAAGAGSAQFAQAAGDALGMAASIYANRTVDANAELGTDPWAGNDPFRPGTGSHSGV